MEDITKPFKITGSASVPKAGYNYFLRAFSDIDVLPMWLSEYLIYIDGVGEIMLCLLNPILFLCYLRKNISKFIFKGKIPYKCLTRMKKIASWWLIPGATVDKNKCDEMAS